jgi:hypothetical protein
VADDLADEVAAPSGIDAIVKRVICPAAAPLARDP